MFVLQRDVSRACLIKKTMGAVPAVCRMLSTTGLESARTVAVDMAPVTSNRFSSRPGHTDALQLREIRGASSGIQPGKSFAFEAAKGGKGGVVNVEPAECFEAVPLAPIGVTKTNNLKAEVEVMERCCLDSLRKTEGKPCLIVMANEGLPLKQNCGLALHVFQDSNLCAIMEATAGTAPVSLPRQGGNYARSVLVHQLSDETVVSFESSMVLMRTLWRTPEAEVAEQPEDGKTRLLHVLHKCRARGHTELVFGAWGLLDHTPLEEIYRISELLHDAVLGSSDVAKSFNKVIFAVGHLDKRLQQAMRKKMQ